MPDCNPNNTVTVDITRDGQGTYTVSPQAVNVPLNGCLTITLHGVPSTGCELDFNPSYPYGGSRFKRTATQTDGPFTQNQTFTYTVKDWSSAPQTPGTQAADRAMTGGNTIQVGS